MSEYQYVMFQAVDRPLNDNQLKYAQRQSTRADVSRWSLSVEYHYSSFRGDVDGLLRRGYDVFLQHTNYLLWLCAADDDYNDPAEMIEPPVPHGISDMMTYGGELLSFFGLDPLLLLAAGRDVEAAPTDESKDQALARWVQVLKSERSRDLLLQLLSGDTVSVKANL